MRLIDADRLMDSLRGNVLIRRQGEQIGDAAKYLVEKYNIRGDADGQESDLRVRGCESAGEGDGGRHTE